MKCARTLAGLTLLILFSYAQGSSRRPIAAQGSPDLTASSTRRVGEGYSRRPVAEDRKQGESHDEYAETIAVTPLSSCLTLTADVNPINGGTVTINVPSNCTSAPSKPHASATEAGPTAATGSSVGTGRGRAREGGVRPLSSTAQYNFGTIVTVTPTANSGFAFQSWTGCDSTSGNDCVVTMNASRSVTANFMSTSTLRIASVSPPVGRTSGGQSIVMNGAFSGLSSVSMGGVAASFSFTSGTSQITVTSPAHAAGAVSIDLTPTSGTPYTKANAFAYLPTTFTDNSLVVGVTTAKAQHIIELRQVVDSMRAVAGLGPASYTNSGLTPFSTVIKAVDITELRSFLENAAGLLGFPAGSYTDPGLTSGFVIKQVHVEELRQRIRNLAG